LKECIEFAGREFLQGLQLSQGVEAGANRIIGRGVAAALYAVFDEFVSFRV